METVLKSVSLGFLLRSVFAGTFFVLTYSVATKNTSAEIQVNSGNLFSFGMVFALVAGVTVYRIHRSVIYPWLEWAIDANWAKRLRKRGVRLISDNVIRELVDRWDRKAEKEQRHAQMHCRAEQITVWADFIHLQYTSAWCIFAGLWAGQIVGQPCHLRYWRLLIAIGVFFAIAATVSTWRARSVEEYWSEPASPR
jgi:hypothetical protein